MFMVGKSGQVVAISGHRKTSSLPAKKSVVRLAMIVLAVLLGEASYAAVGDAATGRFSEQQINSYVKIVTTEIELSANRGSNFGASATTKLYCHPTVLGEGVRSGVHGIYTWFTCSAMHKLNLSEINSKGVPCTGFSMPIWIATSPNTISYKAISGGAEYISFRASAPIPVQTFLDSSYSQMSQMSKVSMKPSASFASFTSCK